MTVTSHFFAGKANKNVNWEQIVSLLDDPKVVIHMTKGVEAAQQAALRDYAEFRRTIEAPVRVLYSFV